MELKKEYDVIVVGAGPGGAITALKCAEGGLNVLLLEKRQEIGTPKRCGECVAAKSIKNMGFSTNENFVIQKINGSVITAPNKKEIILNYTEETMGIILERKLFDKALCYKAADAGTKVMAKATVMDVIKTDGKVVGVKAKIDGNLIDIKSKIVIASDGIESKVSRLSGLNTVNETNNIAAGFQYEMAGIKIKDQNKLYLYSGTHIAPKGYIWIFPKGKTVANVGIGIIGNHEKTAKEYLDEWIETQPNIKQGSIIEINAGGIAVGGFLKNMVLDNFMVVGDAAHQVNPVHGGGISEAMYAAEIASKIAIKAIKLKDTSRKILNEYNEIWWIEQGEKLKTINKYRQFCEKLNDEDMNIIMNSMNGVEFINLSNGNGKKLIKIILKNPRLLKLARHIL
ncbi:MAG: NAD(P)/FAD-dependent oxidoreductase [Candidatus Aenigmarchaeota archaeon]|nr:NAD(P)/FAD-dependent oxidoreductase [Candidatus Aenigmarchaeota archaeon]